MPQTARELMREPLTVAAATPVLEVQHLLVIAEVTGMPVIDARGTIVAMLEVSDVLRTLDQALDEHAGDADPLAHVRSLTARDIATADAVWVAPATPAAEIAERMRSAGAQRVLVGTDDQLEGIVTAFDLIAAITP